MMFDFQEVSMAGGVAIYPDFPYAGLPIEPGLVKETVYLTGTSATAGASITGTADQRE